jgi:hypothetical protein
MRNLTAFFLLIGLFLISSNNFEVSSANGPTNAKCAMLNFEQAYDQAKAVFVGEAIAIETDGDKKIFEFKVKKFWKGIEDTKIKVSVYENMRYQSPYKVGETFLVYAKDDEEGGLFDGRCSRSRDIEGFDPSLKEDLKSLGEGKTCISLSGNKEEKESKKESKKKRRVNE